MRFAVLLFFGPLSAFAACEAPQLSLATEPVTEKQPRIAWAAAPAATAYRVRVQSRVPDGRVLAAYETVVNAPQFLPPRPLAEHQAKVTVRLSALCGSETSAESVSTFMIDTSSACKLAGLELENTSLKWPAVPGARSYEVRAYRLTDGRLIASQETRDAGAQLPLKESAVISVRPACAAGLGEALYRVLAR
jgi:hypothetical protein